MSASLPRAPTDPELTALLESVRDHEMTTEERFEQRVSWVYGMLGENSTVTKDEIRERLMEEMMAPKSFKKAFEEAKKRPAYWKECAEMAVEGEARTRELLESTVAQNARLVAENQRLRALLCETRRDTLPWRA